MEKLNKKARTLWRESNFYAPTKLLLDPYYVMTFEHFKTSLAPRWKGVFFWNFILKGPCDWGIKNSKTNSSEKWAEFGLARDIEIMEQRDADISRGHRQSDATALQVD